MAQIIRFVGYSDSGKTTVVSNLIKILKRRGYRVAAIKHAAHGYNVDIPGKDSWLHYQAGADKVVTVGPESLTTHERIDFPLSLGAVLKRISEVDFILIEGFKNEGGSMVEVVRQESLERRITYNRDLAAIVSDIEFAETVPRFTFDQMEELVDYLIINQIGETSF
ncbi:MAG: molybdopterin-guanine dinucleotide biosynthesis protein B [Syntrophomonadaceae bacterium]|jgi:molybdopterin-guanine dinucleotide biosynthesis protein MobB